MAEESWPVKVYIYDISKGMARSLSQAFIGKISKYNQTEKYNSFYMTANNLWSYYVLLSFSKQ
jgi:hypothetical protein